MHRPILAATVSSATVLSACQIVPSTQASKSEVESALLAWVTALDSCDVGRIAALYHPEAVLWGTTSPAIVTTPEGVRQYCAGTCAANMQLKVKVDQQFVRVYGDAAINSGSCTVAYVANGRSGSFPARYSFTCRRAGNQWLIVDHHSPRVPAPPQPASSPSR